MEQPGVGSVEPVPLKLTDWPDCGAWLSAVGFATGFCPGVLMVKFTLLPVVICPPLELIALRRTRAWVEAMFEGTGQYPEVAE